MENEEVETIVDQSGIRMWHVRSWRDRFSRKELLVLILGVVVLIGLFISLVMVVIDNGNKADDVKKFKAEAASLEEDNKGLQIYLNAANAKVKDCQADLTTAWAAWERRNDMFVSVVGHLFTDNSSEIDADNALAAMDVLDGRSCQPSLGVK